jgi:hypothetical protein
LLAIRGFLPFISRYMYKYDIDNKDDDKDVEDEVDKDEEEEDYDDEDNSDWKKNLMLPKRGSPCKNFFYRLQHCRIFL